MSRIMQYLDEIETSRKDGLDTPAETMTEIIDLLREFPDRFDGPAVTKLADILEALPK